MARTVNTLRQRLRALQFQLVVFSLTSQLGSRDFVQLRDGPDLHVHEGLRSLTNPGRTWREQRGNRAQRPATGIAPNFIFPTLTSRLHLSCLVKHQLSYQTLHPRYAARAALSRAKLI
ncbi:hypothetical protein L226DRAFT_208223 [Lentinus tigrinus ALCF2SS1-7]|uniref:uncharacterized protein n=1 Tax=Lentinus tigrinus ALCF2SS1-7 TaxID=1328758 RepID=UPI001165F3F3|nr:hypothetical protein L226DRAFT_208223 [Lentinus tigrinus ALCF2SS1-7]